ncbi:hypothetical protein ACWC2K_27455 [Streptomyces chattanoogensis]
MRRPSLLRRSPVLDLIAFVMVLATGITLVALGLSPESLAAVSIALAGLYSAWRTGRPPAAPPTGTDAGRPLERGGKEGTDHAEDGALDKADTR